MKTARHIVRVAFAAVLGLALAACQPSDPSNPKIATLSSIAVVPGSATLEVGAMQSLRVVATYSDGSTSDVSFQSTFDSSNSDIAAVSPTGVVTAKANGTARITASASGKSATSTITVSPLRVISISVTPSPVSLAVGSMQQLKVVATYNNLSTGDVTAGSTFVSGNTEVATVSATGLVSAVATGSATITVTHTDSLAFTTVPVTVTENIVLTPLVNGVWASNYSPLNNWDLWLSEEGGSVGVEIGAGSAQYWWNGVAPGATPPHYYFGYGINPAVKPGYFGTYVKAPNDGTADVSGYSSVTLSVWGNPELMSTHPTLTVILKGPSVAGCSYELQGEIAVTATGVQTYTLPLGDFTLQTPCGHASVADALATGLSEIKVRVLGDNIQYVTPAPAPNTDYYANGLNVGPITFKSAPPVAPTTPAPTPPARNASDVLSVYSDAYTQIADVNLNPPWGQSTVVTEVMIGGNHTLKLANLNYQGIEWASSPIDVTAMTRLHVDVWTPDVTTLNVSVISAGQENAVALSPTAAGWNSYDIDMALYTVPDKSAVIQLKFEGAPAPGTVFLDNIYFWKPAAPTFDGVWASNYSQPDAPTWNWQSAEGGDAGTYVDTSVPIGYWWGDVAPGDTPPNFYFGYGINSASKPWGFGAFVNAPGNGTVDVTAYHTLSIYVWGNPDLMNHHPNLTVVLRGPSVGGCQAEVMGVIAVTSTGVNQYTLPLGDFTMKTPCGYGSPADVIAGGLAEIHVQVLGDNVQYDVPADANGNYANGLNVGPIAFN